MATQWRAMIGTELTLFYYWFTICIEAVVSSHLLACFLWVFLCQEVSSNWRTRTVIAARLLLSRVSGNGVKEKNKGTKRRFGVSQNLANGDEWLYHGNLFPLYGIAKQSNLVSERAVKISEAAPCLADLVVELGARPIDRHRSQSGWQQDSNATNAIQGGVGGRTERKRYRSVRSAFSATVPAAMVSPIRTDEPSEPTAAKRLALSNQPRRASVFIEPTEAAAVPTLPDGLRLDLRRRRPRKHAIPYKPARPLAGKSMDYQWIQPATCYYASKRFLTDPIGNQHGRDQSLPGR